MRRKRSRREYNGKVDDTSVNVRDRILYNIDMDKKVLRHACSLLCYCVPYSTFTVYGTQVQCTEEGHVGGCFLAGGELEEGRVLWIMNDEVTKYVLSGIFFRTPLTYISEAEGGEVEGGQLVCVRTSFVLFVSLRGCAYENVTKFSTRIRLYDVIIKLIVLWIFFFLVNVRSSFLFLLHHPVSSSLIGSLFRLMERVFGQLRNFINPFPNNLLVS